MFCEAPDQPDQSEEEQKQPEVVIDISLPTMVKIEVHEDSIKDFKSHNAQTAVITDKAGELLLIDHANEKYDINALKAVKANKICDIIELEVGAGHFLALKRSVIPGIADYTSEQLTEWIVQVGFPECENVIKFGKIDGAKLTQEMALGDEFMFGILGILTELEKAKFRTEFVLAESIKVKEVSVYGWG